MIYSVPAFRLPTVRRRRRSHMERPTGRCHLGTMSAHLKKTTETVSMCGPRGSSCYLGHLQNFLIDWLMLWLHVGRWSRWPWWVVRVSAEKQGHARRITRQTDNIWQWQWLDVSSLSPGLRQLLTIVTDLVGCVHKCAGATTAGPISGPLCQLWKLSASITVYTGWMPDLWDSAFYQILFDRNSFIIGLVHLNWWWNCMEKV